MKKRIAIAVCIATCSLVLFTYASRQSEASSETTPGKITIYRDDYGVPHIYAATHEAGLYASGWAQAEDRL